MYAMNVMKLLLRIEKFIRDGGVWETLLPNYLNPHLLQQGGLRGKPVRIRPVPFIEKEI